MTTERGIAKTRVGKVVSNKMEKTAVVAITRMTKHPVYGKYIKKTVKYFAHDEKNVCGIGDTVKIVETRPLSRHKRWAVQSVISKSAEME